MKWIDVKKELPEAQGEYIVYGLDIVTTLDFIDGYWWSNVFMAKVAQNKISHWMPLPKAPDKKLKNIKLINTLK